MKRLVLPATMKELGKMLAFVDACAAETGLDPTMSQRVALAAEEVIVNIIRYAYPEGAGKIEIQCGKKNGEVALVFRDWGAPFNPLEAPEPDIHLPLEQRKIGGMGILLVKKMIPNLRYERKKGANRLTFGIPIPENGEQEP